MKLKVRGVWAESVDVEVRHQEIIGKTITLLFAELRLPHTSEEDVYLEKEWLMKRDVHPLARDPEREWKPERIRVATQVDLQTLAAIDFLKQLSRKLSSPQPGCADGN